MCLVLGHILHRSIDVHVAGFIWVCQRCAYRLHWAATARVHMSSESFANLVRMQGGRHESLLTTSDDGEHARLRKAFNAFFTMSNVELVIQQVLHDLNGACALMQDQAHSSAEGFCRVDVSQLATALVDDVVWHVRAHCCCHTHTIWQQVSISHISRCRNVAEGHLELLKYIA